MRLPGRPQPGARTCRLLALAVLDAAGEEPAEGRAEGREEGAAERPFEAGRELGRPGGEGSPLWAGGPSCPSLYCLAQAAELLESMPA